jgi:uncharacterized protein YjiS (DUF1127 family)
MTLTVHRFGFDRPLPARVLAASAAMAKFVGRRVIAMWRHRSDMAVLASLDERALADMGLSRADVRDAVSQPLWRDPTAVLADRRRERSTRDYRAIFTQIVRERSPSPSSAAGSDRFAYPPTNRSPHLTV